MIPAAASGAGLSYSEWSSFFDWAGAGASSDPNADANADGDIEAKLRGLATLGHPYSDQDIAGAAASLEGATELDALIAYLQMLGTGMEKTP